LPIGLKGPEGIRNALEDDEKPYMSTYSGTGGSFKRLRRPLGGSDRAFYTEPCGVSTRHQSFAIPAGGSLGFVTGGMDQKNVLQMGAHL